MDQADDRVPRMTATAANYKNFRDLRGLLLRMLRSGDRAAYATLVREAAAKLLVPLDLLLSPWESRRIAAAQPTDLPLILIVGPPRGGTTLVTQVLSRYLDVATVNNLSALFPRAPITATRWFDRLLPNRPPRFTSFYGQTLRLGDPNEGFHVWNRWLGSDRYHAVPSMDAQTQHDMRCYFDAWLKAVGKPLLSKHIRNTDAMTMLADALPNSYFLGVTRNPRMVVQSLILARQQVQGNKSRGWGLYSRVDRVRADRLGYVDDVCRQVMQAAKQLERAKAEVGAERYFEIDYDALCRDPRAVVFAVAGFVPRTRVREERLQRELFPFEPSNQMRLTSEERQRMEQVLSSY